jgi:dTDP-glucose 4,6-dehydratase
MEPDAFLQTDVYGTYVLLEASKISDLERYHQVSTDEVYGEIPPGYSSRETDALDARSPYSASKAGADLLCLAYYNSFGVPVTITRGANNIGPYQYPEKVVPLFITNALDDLPLPLYGDGLQMRDYQYVVDHCEGIDVVLHDGEVGEVYNVGSGEETENIVMARAILDLLGKPYGLIRHVADRPGHDRRYSLNVDKLRQLGWQSQHTFAQAIEKSVRWYVENEWWWRKIKSGEYREYYKRQYGQRFEDASPANSTA